MKFDQKNFMEGFPEALKGFARQLWEAEGCSPSQAEGACMHGHDGMGMAQYLQGGARSLM